MGASAAPSGRTFRSRLALRVGLALGVGALLTLVGVAGWSIALQRQHMTGVLTSSAVHGADIVRLATHDAMLENRRDHLQRILHGLGEQPQFARIRIFDKQGRIRYSTQDDEIGAFVDLEAEQCVSCHLEEWTLDVLTPEKRVREFDGGVEGILGVTTPIPNEPACSSAPCHVHPADQRVLGVLDVQVRLAPVEHHVLASEQQMALGLALTALALLALSAFVLWRMVIQPVRRLTIVARQVAAGDLTARAPVTSSDEIGELTHAWNETVEELDSARDRLQELIDGLEDRVAEKTAELHEAHDQMLQVEKMASLGKLAAVVAHEINNPLAGIATYARLLRRRAARLAESDAGNGENARILELMESEAARCGEIVRNLLLFSRTPGRRFTLTDLRELLERCVLLFHHQAELSEIDVRLRVAEDLPQITCDASQVQQLVLALAMNAIEAMSDGGRLTILAEPGVEGTVLLSVGDTGPGIAQDDLPHVFEPFFTTKPEGKGVGLGLAVVYGIARRHAGSVGVRSREGYGTTFSVRLPVSPPDPPDPAEGEHRLLEGVIS